jgi:putative ABC transport system permease protein
MWRITWRGVMAHKGRYWLTGLSVLLGVAFLAGTLVFTATIRQTFNGLYDDIYHGTAAVVRGPQYISSQSFSGERGRIDASLEPLIRRTPGVAAVAVSIGGYAQLVGSNGKAIGNPAAGAPTLGEVWVPVPALSPYRLLPGGRAPTSGNEVAIDKHSADVGHLKVGQQVLVLTKSPPRLYRIVGIVTWGTADSPLGASITLFDQSTAARVLGVPGKVDEFDVQATPGTSQDQVVHNLRVALAGHPDVQVASGQQVTQEGQNSLANALGIFNTFLVVFALIALFVGAFIILNTFSIVVAQRRRELALLRAVGASRSQVLGSIVGEALVVGVAASALGLLAGLGVALLLRGGLSLLGFGIPANGLVVTVRTVVISIVVGTAITVIASLAPARRAARTPPVAALRQEAAEATGGAPGRLAGGLALLVLGLAAMLIGLYTHVNDRVGVVGVGIAVAFVGVAVLGPVVARPLAGAIGAPLARWRGVTGRIARENAMRNPRRTSSTAAALMVGVALVVLMTILASSLTASVNAAITRSMKADFVITAGTRPSPDSGLSPRLETQLAALPQVAVASGIEYGQVTIAGKSAYINGADPRTIGQVIDVGVVKGHLEAMTPKGIGVSEQVANSQHLVLGSPVRVVFPTTGPRTYAVQVVYTDRQVAGDYVLTSAAMRANLHQPLDSQVYVKLAPGVSAAQGRQAIDRVLTAYPTAKVLDQSQYKAQIDRSIGQLLSLVYALLILAVAIALVGIANTLALSILERTHELGLLRAVGMTRTQLRGSIRAESLVISVLGTLEGLVLGVAFGWVIVAAMSSSGLTSLSFPVSQLAAIVIVGGLAGMLAARRPARRAARLDVLQAIRSE